jgi:hypothetical protein
LIDIEDAASVYLVLVLSLNATTVKIAGSIIYELNLRMAKISKRLQPGS